MGVEDDRARLIEQHLPLVNHVVVQVAVRFPRYVDRQELARAGALGLVEAQLWALFGLASVEAETGEARTAARVLGHTTELASRLGADYMDADDVRRQTFATLEAALGPELLASELAAGAALSLEDAIGLALGLTPP